MKPIRFQFRTPARRGRQQAIFLDRDGVINERIGGGYVTNRAEFRFLDGMVPVLRALGRFRLPMIVVSNQAGVGKGLMRERSLGQITTHFVEFLARHGARIDAVYYCPHTGEDACSCRKPKAGMLLAAARDYRIDLSRSVLIGDSRSDMEAASAAGGRGILFGGEESDHVTVGQPEDLPARVAEMLGRLVL